MAILDEESVEMTTLRGSGKLLRSGRLAYSIEKGGDPRSSARVRVVFPACSIKGYERDGNGITLKFKKILIDITYPPRLAQDECKDLFVAIKKCAAPEITLLYGDIGEINLNKLDTFFEKMLADETFAVPENPLGLLGIFVHHHIDYVQIQCQSILREINKKTSNTESTFGGQLEGVKIQSEDQDEKVVIIQHTTECQQAITYTRVDDSQSFILHFPGETKLEAKWPDNYMEDYITSRVFKLALPGITDRHRTAIRDSNKTSMGDFESQFR
ncbi:hypothetical protein TWF730_006156 [Orbilia blumenaviensis]|uniref:Uncharacterized protein n=1 Tax=Orbilia blumenaviensis TaxID=1796055 RepID=A0AAV9TYN7_9PEZI